MRIPKYLSEKRIVSRREGIRLLKGGQIKLNGRVVKDLRTEIDPQKDRIELVGKLNKTTILYYKPRGISSSKVISEGKNIFDLIPDYSHLNTVGRLDKESEGLILLSDDGVLAKLVTGDDHKIEKEYLVSVRERINQSQINAFKKGMVLEDGPTLPAKAQKIDDYNFSIILKEGRNHQIRRMANKVRLTITKLKRTRIADFNLEGLAEGEVKVVEKKQVQKLINKFS